MSKVITVPIDKKFILTLKSSVELSQEEKYSILAKVHEWYFSEQKFIIIFLGENEEVNLIKVEEV